MFYQASGLKLNYTKTEILATGRRAPFYTNQNLYRLKWVKDRVYALGTWFYKDHRKTVRENNSVKNSKSKRISKVMEKQKINMVWKNNSDKKYSLIANQLYNIYYRSK